MYLAIKAGIPPPCSPQQQVVIKSFSSYTPDGQVSTQQGILIHPAPFYHISLSFANFKITQKREISHILLCFCLCFLVFTVFTALFGSIFHQNCIFGEKTDVNFAIIAILSAMDGFGGRAMLAPTRVEMDN